ncbi:MAG: type II secretion system F family protein [Candidatus Bathyarchaeota archaeon]|nr:MAG: type II secretion system F family protein [Candidatus Bathyarchaeota archaeon]
MLKIKPREKKIAWIISICTGFIIFVTAVLILRGYSLFEDFLFIAIIITIFPPAVVNHLEHRWKRSIDERLPEMFRSIVQAQQTGMTLPQALEEVSKRNYGPLTNELKKIVNQMSWGLTFEEALEEFSKRTDTPLVQRTVPLIIEASHSGGHVEKVFAPMGNFIQASLTMEKERKAQTRPYIAIIYVAFFVFVFTIVLLFKTFFVELGGSSIIGFSALASEEAWQIFLHMSIIQGFFGGLVAGKMGEGAVGAGLKHSAILMASGYAALKFLTW